MASLSGGAARHKRPQGASKRCVLTRGLDREHAHAALHLGGHTIVAHELARIAQEAVSNVRHAAASNVRVSLEGVDGVMLLTVDDDGVGVTPDGVTGGDNPTRGTGVGLAAMRERAERINGRLSIGERPGGGTRVQLECPMQEARYG